MFTEKRLKTALLAAASVGAAAAIGGHALAAERTIAPIEIVHAVDDAKLQGSETAVAPMRQVGLAALAAGILAAIVRLTGWRNIVAAAKKTGPAVRKAAKAAAKAPVAVAKTVASALASPFRYLAMLASLVLTALLGIGIYDIEWMAGLLIGAATITVAWAGAGRATRAFAKVQRRETDKG